MNDHSGHNVALDTLAKKLADVWLNKTLKMNDHSVLLAQPRNCIQSRKRCLRKLWTSREMTGNNIPVVSYQSTVKSIA